MIETGEILQTMAMIQEQNFDIRTITLGINLLDCSHPSPEACAQRVYDKICRVAKDLVRTGEAIERELGNPAGAAKCARPWNYTVRRTSGCWFLSPKCSPRPSGFAPLSTSAAPARASI